MSRYIPRPDFPSFLSFRTETVEITGYNITFCIRYKYFFGLGIYSYPIRNCYFCFSSISNKIAGYYFILFHVNPEKPDVPLNKNDAFQKVQKRRVQEKR